MYSIDDNLTTAYCRVMYLVIQFELESAKLNQSGILVLGLEITEGSSTRVREFEGAAFVDQKRAARFLKT